MAEGDACKRRLTPAPQGGERPYSFLRAVGSTLVYCYRCTNVGFVNLTTSAAPWIACKGAFIQDPPNHRRLRLQWAYEHRAWQADWHQVVFSDESSYNLWNHDGRIRSGRYAGDRCLPKCVIERQVMIWGVISNHGRSNF
ncbi:transposable element Tcb1 transposase [Trichonephila clavipes]|nr:transposable element Tcb1 transposase [Trichonephila clavipes]